METKEQNKEMSKSQIVYEQEENIEKPTFSKSQSLPINFAMEQTKLLRDQIHK